MVLLPRSSRTFGIHSPRLWRAGFAGSFKYRVQARNLEQTLHATLQSLQTQCPLKTACDLECFKQGRNAGGVNIGDIRQIHDDVFRWLALQYRQKPIPEIWRRIDTNVAIQAQACTLFTLLNGDVK